LLDNGLKPYSCCHLIHFVFDALDELRDRRNFGAADVAEVVVTTNSEPILSHIGSIIEPTDILGAQFSLPFSVAMRLHHDGRRMHGGNGFWDYLKVDLKEPVLLETARKVRVEVATDAAHALTVDEGAGVLVRLTDGTELKSDIQHSWGLPENPMTVDEVSEKFHYLTDPIMPTGRPRQIVEAVANVRSLSSVGNLMELMVVGSEEPERSAAE
jgi:2-methylcitrate dehydratase PrpD